MRKMMLLAFVMVALMACRSDSLRINVNFVHVSGIENGDRIVFDGNTAGHVLAVNFNQDGSYTVQLEIEKGFVNAATEYSRFSVIDDPQQPGRKCIHMELSQQGGALLADGSALTGEPPKKDLGTVLQQELEAGIGFLKKQINQFGKDVQAIPESQEYKDLRKSLESLAAEIEQKEKQAREKVKKEWLPRIQRELDDLRERLRQLGREEAMEPLDREMERIRNI
jgi:hypothetical protein